MDALPDEKNYFSLPRVKLKSNHLIKAAKYWMSNQNLLPGTKYISDQNNLKMLKPFHSVPYFLILLWLMSDDDFTHQGETSQTGKSLLPYYTFNG